MHYFVISKRPRTFHTTRLMVSRLLPFVTEFTVLIPDDCHDLFGATGDTRRTSVVTESSILSQKERKRLPDMDHQSRNFLLRHAANDRLHLPDEYILADDDTRPLKGIDRAFFKSSGKYNSYWFYRMDRWPSAVSDFDLGQINTRRKLQELGVTTRSFASHMPQIINRSMFRETGEQFGDASLNKPLCEWSSYFNLAQHRYPEYFHDPRTYRTLVWPEHPRVWPMDIKPTEYAFENVNPVLYRSNGLFSDLTGASDYEVNGAEKIARWIRFSAGYLSGRNRFLEDAALDGIPRTAAYRFLRLCNRAREKQKNTRTHTD